MRAASFASVLAISLAGAACSEKAPAETETPETASESSQPEAGQFNLRYPTTSSQSTSAESAGEFNLRIPDAASQQPDSVRLPEGAVREDVLSGIQEIETPPLPDNEKPADPDDEIIRLD